MASYLRKTFLLYDALPVQKLPEDESATLTDGNMPLTSQQALDKTASLKFPSSFLWGTATAAYQIEGGLHQCNWSMWEKQGTRQHDGQPTVEGHQKAGRACNSWEMFDQDLEAMKKLGMKMYRFSVEWSRIEPACGSFDEAALQRYLSWCQKLKAAGIEPMVTLHHFTEPDWFVEKGGWEVRENIDYFQAFVERTTEVLAPSCNFWTTMNELNGYAICGWLAGVHPPGKVNDFLRLLRVVRHLLVAHTRAAQAILSASATNEKDPVICMALSHVYFLPFDDEAQGRPASPTTILGFLCWIMNRLLSSVVALFLNYVFNFIFLDAIFSPTHAGRFPLFPFPFHLAATLAGWGQDIRNLKASCDWIGVNHYYRSYVQFGRVPPKSDEGPQSTANIPRQASPTDMFIALPLGLEIQATAIESFEKNEMGWDLTPSSMAQLLKILWDRYQPVPIIITESGTADKTDKKRVRYIAAILCALHEMMMQSEKGDTTGSGVDIRGYLIWTLLDNFEW